jgi:ketosteroid isomerase-like protein
LTVAHSGEISLTRLKRSAAALILLSLPAISWASANADILKLEQQFNAAYAANDLPAYFSFYADDAILWFPEGRTDLPSYKESWTKSVAAGDKIQSAAFSDFHVKLSPSGDTAVASYQLHINEIAAGKVSEETYQETDVWFKVGGSWKIVQLHYSAAPALKPK